MTAQPFYTDCLFTAPAVGGVKLTYPKGNAKVYWAADYDALAAELASEKQQLDNALSFYPARIRELEAFAKRVADSDMTGGAPAYVFEARKLLHSAPETGVKHGS